MGPWAQKRPWPPVFAYEYLFSGYLLGDGAVQPAPAVAGDVVVNGQDDVLGAQLIGRSLVQRNHEDILQSVLFHLDGLGQTVVQIGLGLLGVVGI